MSIYYVRHGQTAYNLAYKIQGSIDAPLDQTGIKQAKATRDKLKDVHLDLIFSSPLIRAKKTAEIINEAHHLDIRFVDALREEHYGDFEGKSRHGEDYFKQRSSFAHRYPNGESYLDVAARVFPFLDYLKKNYKDKDILLVAHGGISRIVNAYFVDDMENEQFISYLIDNCEVKRYEFK